MLSAWFLFLPPSLLPPSAAADINLVGETEETEKIPGGGIASAHSRPRCCSLCCMKARVWNSPSQQKINYSQKKRVFFHANITCSSCASKYFRGNFIAFIWILIKRICKLPCKQTGSKTLLLSLLKSNRPRTRKKELFMQSYAYTHMSHISWYLVWTAPVPRIHTEGSAFKVEMKSTFSGNYFLCFL